MKVRKINVSGFGVLHSFILDVPPDASVICLTGGNGTGKTSVLKVISSALAHLGVAHGSSDPALNQDGDRFGYELVLDFSDEPNDLWNTGIEHLQGLSLAPETIIEMWDRTLTVRSVASIGNRILNTKKKSYLEESRIQQLSSGLSIGLSTSSTKITN